jgi:hypothetical protein
MHKRIGAENPIYADPNWSVVRSYNEFIAHIMDNGIPDLISFDHDLADGHYTEAVDYNEQEKTGYHAAKWLIDYCMDNKKDLPRCFVHSMNPAGTDNIVKLFENFKKHGN